MKFNYLLKKAKSTVNYEGTTAFVMTPEMELYAAVVTASLNDQFYEHADDRLQRICGLISRNNPVFVARLAVYAREQMYLRSIPMVLTVELAKIHAGDNLVSKMVARVVQRADEVTELLSYYSIANERIERKKLNRLSKQLQKGLSVSFNRFEEYQFAKYNRQTAITIKDALFLVHPKAKDEAQQLIFNKIVNDQLQTPYTWETELSALGQQSFATDEERLLAVTEKWKELVYSSKLGYMAMLRNLRNILQAAPGYSCMKQVCETISSPAAVVKAKQMPFRFLAAYRELKALNDGCTGMVLQALEGALQASVANLKGFDGQTRVVIACDVSGSMQKPVSAKSKVLLFDIGLLLGMLLQYKCKKVVMGMFGNTWKIIEMSRNTILANVDEFYRREGEVGYATNGYTVLNDLIARGHVADKIMMFTDCQLWNRGANNMLMEKWRIYKQLAPRARLYLFDLAGYGQTPLQMEGNDVFLIAGWSDKVFDVMHALENGADAVTHINAIDL